MTLNEFLNHWSITENPFRGEEARDDAVFARMSGTAGMHPTLAGGLTPPAAQTTTSYHSDFEKILGDLSRPATAIVFGEKGSGKTAIRLQLAARVNQHNASHPNSRVLLVGYDDLNAYLARVHERYGGKTPLESFQSLRLVDHLDGVLCTGVPRLVDTLLGASTSEPIDLGAEPRKACRRLTPQQKRDLLALQAVYDRSEQGEWRTIWLRRKLGLGPPWGTVLGDLLVYVGPVLIAALWTWGRFFAPEGTIRDIRDSWLMPTVLGLLCVYVLWAAKHLGWDRVVLLRDAKRLRKQIRVGGRAVASYAKSLRRLPRGVGDAASLPLTDSDETRYELLAKFRRVMNGFGYSGILVVVDRVDEPTLVSGDPDRMRAIIWPILNNKFLQQEGLGVKLLLPVELRYLLFKESSAFFQDARLDKQNFIERLTWTGAMLYDLCDSRLQACRPQGAAPMTLIDLFTEDVTRQDVVDALDQMHQPRDAFKFLYRCMTEHTSNVTRDQNAWKIPKLVLDHIRKQESDRVQQLHRGIRPA